MPTEIGLSRHHERVHAAQKSAAPLPNPPTPSVVVIPNAPPPASENNPITTSVFPPPSPSSNNDELNDNLFDIETDSIGIGDGQHDDSTLQTDQPYTGQYNGGLHPPHLNGGTLDPEIVQQLSQINELRAKFCTVSNSPAPDGICRTLPAVDHALLELLDLLDDANAPHYLFQKILKWAFESNQITNGFNPGTLPATTRKGFVNCLRKTLCIPENREGIVTQTVIALESNDDQLITEELVAAQDQSSSSTTPPSTNNPQLTPSWLADNELSAYDRTLVGNRATATVFRFSLVKQIQDLLDTHGYFDDLDILQVNPSCPWLPYQNKTVEEPSNVADSSSNSTGTTREDNPRATPGDTTRDDFLIDDLLSSKWYRDVIKSLGMDQITTKEEWIKAGKPFLIPLLFYIDKTGTDMMCRYSLEPLLFTLGLFRRAMRMTSSAWRHLGFVPDLDQISSAQRKETRKTQTGKGRTCRNYHKCIQELLRDLLLIHNRKSGSDSDAGHVPIPLRLRLGDEIHWVNAYLPVAYVIGDNKSNDYLCAKIGGYSKTHPRCCRACDCSMADADNTDYRCRFIDQKEITDAVAEVKTTRIRETQRAGNTKAAKRARKAAEERLEDKHHRYYCHNAFDDVWFGDTKRGIHGSTPSDLLHTLREGNLARAVALIVHVLGVPGKAELDNHVNYLFCTTSCHGSDYFPRTNFRKGISNLTKLSAKERVGTAFVLLLFLLNPRGYAIMVEQYVKHFRKQDKSKKVGFEDNGDAEVFSDLEEDDEGEGTEQEASRRRRALISSTFRRDLSPEQRAHTQLNNIRELLEMLLCLDAWCNNGPFWHPREAEESENYYFHKIGVVTDTLTSTLPRNKGNGWKLQKTHEMMHFPRYVTLFGHPMNYDSGQGESALKDTAKKPAKNAQKKNGNEFVRQVTERCKELLVKRKAYNLMNDQPFRDRESIKRVKLSQKIEGPAEADDSAFETLSRTAEGATVRTVLRFRMWKMLVYRKPQKAKPTITGFQVQATGGAVVYSPFVRDQIAKFVDREFPTSRLRFNVQFFSEATREVEGRPTLLMRCHPKYRGDMPWYDWMFTKWHLTGNRGSPDTNDKYMDETLYPSKLLALFHLSVDDIKAELSPALKEKMKGPFAVFHCTERVHNNHDIDDPNGDSTLTRKYRLLYSRRGAVYVPSLDVLKLDVVENQCFVVEDYPGFNEQINEKDKAVARLVIDRREHWGRCL